MEPSISDAALIAIATTSSVFLNVIALLIGYWRFRVYLASKIATIELSVTNNRKDIDRLFVNAAADRESCRKSIEKLTGIIKNDYHNFYKENKQEHTEIMSCLTEIKVKIASLHVK